MGDVTTSMRISIKDGLIEISGSEKFVADQLIHHDDIFDMYNEMWKSEIEKGKQALEAAKSHLETAKETFKKAIELINEAQEHTARIMPS